MKKQHLLNPHNKNVKAVKRGKPKAVKAAKLKEIKENIPDTHVISENIISAASIEEAMEKCISNSCKNIEYTDKEQTQIKVTEATENKTYVSYPSHYNTSYLYLPLNRMCQTISIILILVALIFLYIL
jgi:hypothetical protein